MFWKIHPEIPGRLREHSVIDRGSHPPAVSRVHFEFDGWLGDELIAAFPVFLIGPAALDAVRNAGLGGFMIERAEFTFSDEYREMESVSPVLPEPANFNWFKIAGISGSDDFGVDDRHDLIVSNRALDVLREFIAHADISPR